MERIWKWKNVIHKVLSTSRYHQCVTKYWLLESQFIHELKHIFKMISPLEIEDTSDSDPHLDTNWAVTNSFLHHCLKIVWIILGLKYSPLPFIKMHRGLSPGASDVFSATSPHPVLLIRTSYIYVLIRCPWTPLLPPCCSPGTPHLPPSRHRDGPLHETT